MIEHIGFVGNGPDHRGLWCHAERVDRSRVRLTVEDIEGVAQTEPVDMSNNDYSFFMWQLAKRSDRSTDCAQAACNFILELLHATQL